MSKSNVPEELQNYYSAIVTPEEIYKESKVEVPKGYEVVGFRPVEKGDSYLSVYGSILTDDDSSHDKFLLRFILKKKVREYVSFIISLDDPLREPPETCHSENHLYFKGKWYEIKDRASST